MGREGVSSRIWPNLASAKEFWGQQRRCATVKDSWSWHQAGLGHSRTSPAPGWLPVIPPHIGRAQ